MVITLENGNGQGNELHHLLQLSGPQTKKLSITYKRDHDNPQEGIIILNAYNNRILCSENLKKLNREIDKSTITIGDFILLS